MPAKQQEENNGPGDWIVTFSDCMTLLLCFFVLLLTFSSFDSVALKKLSGAYNYRTQGSIHNNPRRVPDSPVETPDMLTMTEKGSEHPTDTPIAQVKNPQKREKMPGQEAHKERKVFYIPCDQMFVAEGLKMKDAGKGHLDRIASFLEMKPCLVVVNESRLPAPDAVGAYANNAALERARKIVEYCIQTRGVSAEYFSIAADGGIVSRERFGGRPVIEIALVAPRVYR